MRGKLLLLLMLVSPMLAQASVVISNTRVVYEEARGEAIVQLRQPGSTPVLVQVWLDDGDENLDPQEQTLPFLVTPTVSRMDPGNGQAVRVLRTGGELPMDRESMFFFNVLEVPPAETELIQTGTDHVQFSTRSRIKFFYRPQGLTPRADKAPELVRFSLVPGAAKKGEVQVKINNPTPYHITFKDLTLHAGKVDTAAVAELTQDVGVYERTVPPMGDVVLPLKSSSGVSAQSSLQVKYGVVGDMGETIAGQRGLD